MILLKPIAIKVAIRIVGRDSETAAVVWRLVVAGVERDVASWGSLQYLNSSAGALDGIRTCGHLINAKILPGKLPFTVAGLRS